MSYHTFGLCASKLFSMLLLIVVYVRQSLANISFQIPILARDMYLEWVLQG